MKARHPIWNILFVLGVLYVIVFGFLYVYMQRSSTAQASESVEESEVVAREVDILDAPLLTEEAQVTEETQITQETQVSEETQTEETQTEEAGTDEGASLEPSQVAEDAPPIAETDVTAGQDANGSEALTTDLAETSPDDVSGDEAASTDPSEPVEEPIGEAAEETATLSDPSEEATEAGASEAGASETAAADTDPLNPNRLGEAPDTDAVAAPLLGSSEPYRYNLNEMSANTKIETEQGWVTFEGKVESPQESQRYFLVVQSLLKDPPTLFSQGELNLGDEGEFEARAKYATYSEFYKTYVVSTANDQAADTFSDEGSSLGLPPEFRVVWPEIEVLVD